MLLRLFAAIALGSACWGQYLISTVAGGSRLTIAPQGVSAVDLRLILPAGVATDAAGNVYVSDSYYDRVLKITPGGLVTTFAGSETGSGGDGGAPTAARFNGVAGLAVSPSGELHICDLRNGRVRKVSRDGSVITTVATVGSPRGLAFDRAGNLYVSDSLNSVVQRVDPQGKMTVYVGPAAQLLNPGGLAVDGAGNLYIADTGTHRVRRVTPDGQIDTFAGTGVAGSQGATVAARTAQLNSPSDVAVNKAGDVYISDRLNTRILRVRGTAISIVAGNGTSKTVPGSALAFGLALPVGIAMDVDEQVVVVDDALRRAFRVNTVTDRITAVAGTVPALAAGDNGPAEKAALFQPSGVAADTDGSFFVSDVIDNVVRKVSTAGTITTVAGTGALGTTTGGVARNVDVGRPRGLAMDRNRNLYIAATWGAYVYKLTPAGVLSVVAGGPTPGFAGDNQLGTAARLNIPFAVAVDQKNDAVYIADSGNHRVRRVDARGIITTFAGTGEAGFSGDGAAAGLARLNTPRGVAVAADGTVYISDSLNHRVRKVDANGRISTVAGTGVAGFGEAQLWSPQGLTLDSAGNLFIACSGSSQVRVLPVDGTLQKVAGLNGSGFTGDGGPAVEARLSSPYGLATGADGSILIADQNNERVRRLVVQRLAPGGVLSRASRLGGAVAPNQILQIQGLGLAGAQVSFDGVEGTVISAEERLVVVAAPAGLAGPEVRVQVRFQDQTVESVTVPVAASAPGVFTVGESGAGQAMARNEDDTDNGEATPALPGALVRLVVTGLGLVDDGGVPVLPVEATVGGLAAEVVSARVGDGQLAGMVEVILRVPAESVAGNLALVVKAGEGVSQAGVTLAVGSI